MAGLIFDPGKRGNMNLGWWRVPVDVAARITAELPNLRS